MLHTTPKQILIIKPGKYIVKPDGTTIGRCPICGKTVHATIHHPEPCRIYCCTHCPYRDKIPCPGDRVAGIVF